MSSALLRRELLQFTSCCSKTMQGALRQTFPCRKCLERRGDVARHRSCAVMRLRNIGCTIFSEGCVEWIQQTQLDDTNMVQPSFPDRYQACWRMSLLHQGQPSTGSARVPPDADRPSFETPSRSSMAICATRVRGGTTSSPKVAAAGSNYRIAIALGRLGIEIEQNPANPRALGTPGNARLAERVGFEPTVRFPAHTLSKRAP